jgi:hypothetical protein
MVAKNHASDKSNSIPAKIQDSQPSGKLSGELITLMPQIV